MSPLRSLRQPLAMLLLVVVALLCGGQGARAADRANVEAFLRVTGFDAALESIAFAAGDAPRLLGMEPDAFGYDWTRVSHEVFDRDKMLEMAIGILERALDDDLLGHAAAFYASPLGQRLVAAENAAHRDADDEARVAEGARLLARDRAAGGAREALFRRMSAAIDSSGQSVRAVQEITVRFLMAASAAGVIEGRLDEAGLRAQLRRREPEMRAEMLERGLANAAWTYRDFSLEELADYAEALEDPRMRKVYELMNAIQYEIMANRFEVLAVRMAEMHPGQEL